ncbi:hypothetical protein C8Q70DRAFT_935960 [Cubamyces menziesii]|nr:hypothetical protein C8Q70DRAFT_935960 [Cubamyces menziesii]
MPTPTPFAGGTYVLFNVYHGTVLTASDGTAVVGEPYAEAKLPFQLWEFIPFSGGFVIRLPPHANNGGPAYLTFEGKVTDEQVTKLGAQPMVWNVTCEIDNTSTEVVRIAMQGHHVDLDFVKGSKVQLYHYKPGENCQRWYAHRRGFSIGLRRSLVNSYIASRPETEQNDHDVGVRNRVAPEPGPHVLLNGEAGTALDVSAAHRRDVKCWAVHKDRNQQWELVPIGDTTNYAIRSGVKALDGRPLYLTVEAPAKVGAVVVATPYPVPWRVEWRAGPAGDSYQ